MENKKSNKGLMVIIITLIILLVGLGGYIAYDKFLSNSDNQGKVKEVKENKKEEKSLVSKLDESKEWVYDADYEKKVTKESYSTGYYTYYSKDIVVPYINIKSPYADESNKEIKSVFDSAIDTYNQGVSDEMTYVKDCNYTKYNDDRMVSIFLQYGVGATSVVFPDYYTYNINLKDGKEMSYKDLYEKFGYDKDSVNDKVESAIKKYMKEEFFKSDYYSEEEANKFIDESIANYKTSVEDDTIKYFISTKDKLNVIVKLMIPVERGEFFNPIEIE